MNIENLVRQNIRDLKPYTSARESHTDGILLDANENSLGSVIKNDLLQLNRYPDPSQKALRNIVGNYLSIPSENLFFGVGSDEIIDLLIRIFCEPKIDNVIIPEPTYGMYKVACDINNVESVIIPLNNNFQLDVSLIKEHITTRTKMIFLCSPNNPTGNVLHKEDILELTKFFNGIVVVDEAYIEFDENYSVIKEALDYPNLVVSRTFSKAWGLAGARCGYCVGSKNVIDLLFKIKAPYNLNKLTINAVITAVGNKKRKEKFVAELKSERERINGELETIPFVKRVLPSNANFLLAEFEDSKTTYNRLSEKGIIVRDRSNQLNLENCLRLTIGSKEENDFLLRTLREIL